MEADFEQAIDMAKRFLSAVEDRDVDRARSLLAPDFRMLVSGGHRFEALADFVAFSAGRQTGTKKQTDHFDTCRRGKDVVVYCSGTLSGQWLNGEPFDGIRYIDRMVFSDGLISAIDVWNDTADFRPQG